MTIKTISYRDLIVWQKAMNLVTKVYKITTKFPKTEIYGITSQIKRCAVSIPSDIAENRIRGSRADYHRFLIIAYASGAELETQTEISKRLYFNKNLNFKIINGLLNEVMRMLNRMIKTMN